MKKTILLALIGIVALTISCKEDKYRAQIAQHLGVAKSEISIKSIDTVYVDTRALPSFEFAVACEQRDLINKFLVAKTKNQYKSLISEGKALHDSLSNTLRRIYNEAEEPQPDSHGNHLRVTATKEMFETQVYISLTTGEIADIHQTNRENYKRCREALYNLTCYIVERQRAMHSIW